MTIAIRIGPLSSAARMGSALGMRCTTCHGETNFEAGHVPGNPNWHLAPIEMAWVGKSLGAICEQIKDPNRNGGKTLGQIVDHVTDDELVGWAWNSWPRTYTGSRDAKAFWRSHQAMGRDGRSLPARLSRLYLP